MAAPVIQFKRGLFSNLPGLRAGEPGFTTDKYDLYVGIDSTTNGNKFFGSHRYWTKETTSAGSGLNLVEGTENGENTITLKAPASIPANYTITWPSAIVTDGYLKVASDGTLSWAPNLTSSTLSISGISTLGQALATTVSATGIITASSFSGSGSGLTAGTVPVSALDIDGATAATALTSDDLFIIDDGAGGTNKKLTAQQLSDYVLGGSGGATFPQISVTGIATINTLKATTSTTTGIATASSFRGSDFRDTDGSLVPLVGVSSASAHTGLVTAFKFTGTGLEEYTVANEIATIKISGVAASTYTTNQVFTATQDQTSFNFTAGYDDGFVDVYLNGIRLISGTDFTANNGADVVLTSGATAGDELEVVSFKELGDVFSLNNLRLAGGLRVTGVATAQSFNGALNQTTGVSTVGQLSAVTVNASGIVTASSFSGSGSGLSAGTVPASAIDIDGATAATALTSDDLFLIDDGAGGTNKKLTAQQLSNFVLGGSGGATFPAINVTGVGTVSQLQATTATVGAGLTVTGATDLNGGLDVSGGETTLSSATVSDLTSGRVVLAGTSGALEDSANLTFGANGLRVTGSANVSGIVTSSAGFSGNINATGVSTASFLQASTVNASGIVTASSFSGSGSGLSAGTVPVSALDIDGATAATALTSDDLFIIDDGAGGTNKKLTAQQLSNFVLGGSGGATFPAINVTGVGTVSQLQATTATVGAGLTVTGATDLNGGLDVSGGETVLSSATVSDLTSGRVVLAGTSGALEDSANLTFGANGLRVTGTANYTGIVTASTFSGPLTGNVTGNLTGNVAGNVAGNVTGNLNSTGVSTVSFLQATTVNVSAAATIPTLSGTTATFTNITANGGFVGNLNSSGVSTATFLQSTNINASGIVTASSFSGPVTGNLTGNVTGNINSTGVSTVSFLQATTVNVSAAATIPTLSGTTATFTNITANGGFSGNINTSGIGTIATLKATTATVGAGLTVTGATDLNGGLDVSGGETVLSSATVSDLTSGRVVLAGTSGALEDSANLTFGVNGLRVTGGANVSAASTFGSNLNVSGNVVVSGDLTVNGTTTQINTVTMTVEDTLLELQMIDGSAPGSDTNKDVGIVMNYFTSSAKKAAFYWDDSASRMVAASDVSESSGVLTASTFAGLEIGSLFVNDCAGASQVISCSGTTRSLENITIDGGSF